MDWKMLWLDKVWGTNKKNFCLLKKVIGGVFFFFTDNLLPSFSTFGFHNLRMNFFFNSQSINYDMMHSALRQWPFQAAGVTPTPGRRGNIIKGMSWWWKTKAKTGRDRQCQGSAPHFKSDTCCSLPLTMTPATRKFVITLSRSLWALLIRSDLYFCTNSHAPLPVILQHSALETISYCHLFFTRSIYVLCLPVCQ